MLVRNPAAGKKREGPKRRRRALRISWCEDGCGGGTFSHDKRPKPKRASVLRCATSICAEPRRVEPANCFGLEFPTNFRDRGGLAGWLCTCSRAESGEAHAPRPGPVASRVESSRVESRQANRPAAFLRAHTKERARGSQLWLLNLHCHHIASLSCPLGVASLIHHPRLYTPFGHPRHPRPLLVLL